MNKSQKVVSAVFWNFSGKTGFYILKFFESLLLVRLLGSEQYGIYGSLLNIQSIIALTISFGLENVIGRFLPQFLAEENYNSVHSLLRKILRIRGLSVVLIGCVFFFFSDFISVRLFHASLGGYYLRLAFVLVALVSFHTIFRSFLDLLFQLKFINILDLCTQASYLVIAYILVQCGYGLTAVLITLICVNASALLILAYKYRKEKLQLPHTAGKTVTEKTKVYAYGGALYILNLLNYVLGKGLDVLLIGILIGDMRQVAYYLLAFNVAFYAVSIMDMAVSANFVVSLIVDAHTRNNMETLRKIYCGLFEFIYLFIVPIVIGGLILRTEIIQLLYKAENLPAASFLALFLIAMSVGKLSSIASTFLVLLNKEKIIAVSRTLFGITNLIFDIILIRIMGAFGAVIATGTIMILMSAFESILLHRLIAPRYSLTFLWKTFAVSMTMGGCVYFLNTIWVGPPVFKVPAIILAGTIIYSGGIFLLKPISPENISLIQKSNLPFRNTLFRLFSSHKEIQNGL